MKFKTLTIMAMAFFLASCANNARRSFAGGQRDVIPVEKQELIRKMEWEVKVMPKAIKICDKKKGKVRVINPSQNIEDIENYSKMRLICNIPQKNTKKI